MVFFPSASVRQWPAYRHDSRKNRPPIFDATSGTLPNLEAVLS